ncbi:hypothetical protein BOTBODRAFT_175915 [Botryobasidium botryosum FD-172 SS1]|uniref:Uncharacterized protein n=1 Tax=Botryobasidium botryosum (strain FD-172 SS1) TaxID=930990 RepID=A0A067MEA9_BOTB1|nr:hypothetical protein BOTBODRAFT_175915 [Botryobasidium botryosum FD-172 SS1]
MSKGTSVSLNFRLVTSIPRVMHVLQSPLAMVCSAVHPERPRWKNTAIIAWDLLYSSQLANSVYALAQNVRVQECDRATIKPRILSKLRAWRLRMYFAGADLDAIPGYLRHGTNPVILYRVMYLYMAILAHVTRSEALGVLPSWEANKDVLEVRCLSTLGFSAADFSRAVGTFHGIITT